MIPTDSEIRDWARRNGYQVGERGRLQENVKEAFYRIHPGVRPAAENPNGTCGECWQQMNAHKSWCSRYVAPKPVVVNEYVDSLPGEDVPAKADEKAIEAPNAVPALSDATAMLGAALEALAANQTPALDEGRVREIAVDAAETAVLTAVEEFTRPQVFNIHFPDRATVTLDERTHAAFEECLSVLMSGDNLFMVGPPGTGKTTLTKQLAKALGVERRFISCSPDMSTTRLAGYMHATGGYVSTGCRDAFETGKLFLLDEGDKGNPGVLAWTHTALENGECEFPDAIVERHENNYWCVAANTYGRGATTNYIGSNKLDDAFIDRFSFVPLDIDEALEEALTVAQLGENRALAIEWLTKVRGWRANAEAANLSFLITPRASIRGAALIRQGMSFERAAELRVWKGIKAETRAKIEVGR